MTQKHEPSEELGCHQQTYETVPGGVICGPESSKYGTSTHRVLGSNGTGSYLLTAAHIFSDITCGTGAKVYQYGQKVGEIVDFYGGLDAAIVDQTADTEVSGFSNKIEGANWGPVNGHVTRNGVIDLAGNETEIYKMGVITCKTSGRIKEDERSRAGSCGSGSGYLRYTCYAEQGDSGGPVYAEKTSPIDGDKYIATIGLITTATICSSAYSINNNTGYIFS
ncbi:hypothetical protein [Halorussus lipolyticus]|uniref:hypothetical protein n=1 Tax=Halorussus lipolyticus TaxID=3034024 RepID=UPI0023E79A5C|nr:hypothetical protein [Halorussus sp. DT80]